VVSAHRQPPLPLEVAERGKLYNIRLKAVGPLTDNEGYYNNNVTLRNSLYFNIILFDEGRPTFLIAL